MLGAIRNLNKCARHTSSSSPLRNVAARNIRTRTVINKRLFSATIPTRNELCIGIDLGTTNSCVALVDGDKQMVIENDGKRTTPSIFAIDSEGNRLVGQPAQRQMVINPSNTFFAVKRLIGRRFDEPEIKMYQSQTSYRIARAPNGDAWVADSTGRMYAPAEVASNILMKLRDAAEIATGQKINRAVITVPAYFDNHQRQATEDAGKIAGLQVDRIINEPTAAALAYGIKKEDDKTVVVYDLGGGTFDISILQIGGGVFEVLSTSGDTFLGGEDFNNIIVDRLIADFKKDHGVDLGSDIISLQRVREAAELAKHDLSTMESVTIELPYIYTKGDQPLTLNNIITRKQYEQMAEPLVQKTIGPCESALRDARLSVDDITDVLLVGGMTRMPRVRDVVKQFFKKEPSLGVNPDEAVALGAALQGSIIANEGMIPGEEGRELILVDVTPLNLGIKVHGGDMAVIVPAQTPIPCVRNHVFTTVQDFQTEIHTEVYQGNRPKAQDNRLIGKYTMTGIPAAPATVPKIDVIFDVSANGTLKVTSQDQVSKQKKTVVIAMSGGLSTAEIEQMRRDAEANKASDEIAKALAAKRNTISKEVEQIKMGMKQHKSLSPEQITAINNEIEKVNKALEEDKDVEGSMSSLKAVAGKAFAEAYTKSQNTVPGEQTDDDQHTADQHK